MRTIKITNNMNHSRRKMFEQLTKGGAPLVLRSLSGDNRHIRPRSYLSMNIFGRTIISRYMTDQLRSSYLRTNQSKFLIQNFEYSDFDFGAQPIGWVAAHGCKV